MGYTWGCSSLLRMSAGRFREALARMDEALALLETSGVGAGWERTGFRTIALQTLFALGSLRERARRAEAWRAEAGEKGDPYAEAEAALASAFARLAAGDAPRARDEVRVASARLWHGGFTRQHHVALWLSVSIHLHEGAPLAAWTLLEEAWPALAASQLLRIQLARIDAYLLRGMAAVALAAPATGAGARRDELLARARADAARLDRERRPHALAGASLVRGGAAWAQGERAEAVAHLLAAARGYGSAEMRVHAACALRAAGVLGGDEAGRARVARADEVLGAEGVVDPARWTRMYTGIWAGDR
jgi:hypothetical protein